MAWDRKIDVHDELASIPKYSILVAAARLPTAPRPHASRTLPSASSISSPSRTCKGVRAHWEQCVLSVGSSFFNDYINTTCIMVLVMNEKFQRGECTNSERESSCLLLCTSSQYRAPLLVAMRRSSSRRRAGVLASHGPRFYPPSLTPHTAQEKAVQQ